MTRRHLAIFTAVCDAGSATAAAEKLHLTQPAVSLAVRELERHYGVRLFDRLSHRLYLTEAGKELLQYARPILSLFEGAETGVRDRNSSGPIRIGSSITIGTCLMPGYVVRFRKLYPKVKIRVVIDDSAAIEKKVLDGSLDFALIEGAVHSDRILSRQFMKDELIPICGTGDGAFAGDSCLPLSVLPSLPFLLREKGSGTRELFDSTMLLHHVFIRPIWESTSTQAILRAVAAGIGISVLPERMVRPFLENHSVRRLTIGKIRFERAYFLILHKDKFLTGPAEKFLALIRDSAESRGAL